MLGGQRVRTRLVCPSPMISRASLSDITLISPLILSDAQADIHTQHVHTQHATHNTHSRHGSHTTHTAARLSPFPFPSACDLSSFFILSCRHVTCYRLSTTPPPPPLSILPSPSTYLTDQHSRSALHLHCLLGIPRSPPLPFLSLCPPRLLLLLCPLPLLFLLLLVSLLDDLLHHPPIIPTCLVVCVCCAHLHSFVVSR